MKKTLLLFSLTIVCLWLQAQKTGVINRQATIASGRTVLDPNGDNYTSATTSGFGTSDVTNSELPFFAVPSFSIEPFGDLRRGPNHLYSDFVPDNGDDGVYLYYSGTNLLFRFRVGSIMSGSKGYSILLDTDGKFGASGATADPNYQAATTGTNGNPGFEIEIVLETNFRIAIYNVDGTSTPVLVKSYTNWQDMSQVSVAGTFDNGDPDFFIDFYIPFADLQAAPFNLTTNSSLRFAATTVMSPQAAIGGPKSDIYGLADNGYKNTNDQYETFIEAQPPVKITDGSFGPMCTNAPVITGSVSVGTVSVSGTWTKSTLTGAVGTANITVYKNGVSAGTVNGVASGAAWTLNNVVVGNGDVITAKAQAAGESMCLVSNAVTASLCTAANRPSLPVLTCANNYGKGVSGSNLATGWVIYVENVTRGTIENSTANPSQFTTSGTSPNITWNYAGGCNGGPNMPSGSYKIYYKNAAGCVSEPILFCLATGSGASNNLAGTSATPVITSILTPGASTLEGTAEPSSTVSLYINGVATQTGTATAAGTFNFTGLSLVTNDQVYVSNVLNTGTVNTSKCFASSTVQTVNCYTQPPAITVDNNNEFVAGTPVTGYSSEPVGTVIKVYSGASTLVATTAVQADGSWSTANAGTLPSSYTSVAATSYYATAQNGTCGISSNSATASAVTATATGRCGTITGPVTAAASSVSGTLTGSFTSTTVTLYLDGISIGTVSTNTAAWGPIAVNTTGSNTLYSNGILTIGIKETGKGEVLCPASATTISCASAPASPIVSPTNYTATANQSVNYTISNAVAGNFYGIADASTGQSLATGQWATSNGNLILTTTPFSTSGTYNVIIKATNLSGLNVCTSTPAQATVAVSSILPVHFLNVEALRNNTGVKVNWTVSEEVKVAFYSVESSANGAPFTAIGKVLPQAATSAIGQYTFMDENSGSGTWYYRIREEDRDGSWHYSRTVAVQAGSDLTISVFPNPVQKSVRVTTGPGFLNTHALLMDLNGKVLQTVPIRRSSFMLDLSSYAKGIYLLKLENNTSIKLMKE
ncbi:MAG TPA: T9SS type A sorting domain-containing protein [Flavisolibacter sp.]|nr:T9SS type A sorting domain-containing protein [Flavisolibacter sp.]